MAKQQRMTGPGVILDRSAKHGTIKIAFDPSPNGFVGDARREKGRLAIRIEAEGQDSIEISAPVKEWVFQLKDAQIPAERLADLEALITDETSVHVSVEYTPEPKLPGLEAGDEEAA